MASLKSARIADPLAWLDSLAQPDSLVALAVFALCVAVSWLMVWLVRRTFRSSDLSVLLGRRLIDGVLFPALLWALTFGAKTVLTQEHSIALFDILLPVCTSLVLIRLGVKVLQVAFGQAPFVRVLERTISWLAWVAVVLWVTGILPLILDELDQIHWKVGAGTLTLSGLNGFASTLVNAGTVALGVADALAATDEQLGGDDAVTAAGCGLLAGAGAEERVAVLDIARRRG